MRNSDRTEGRMMKRPSQMVQEQHVGNPVGEVDRFRLFQQTEYGYHSHASEGDEIVCPRGAECPMPDERTPQMRAEDQRRERSQG
jgi:hypothetical protein